MMSCIGKFRRNLITMKETLYMYLFEKLVYFLDIALFTLVSDITPETLFWAHNAIVLLQSIGRICFFVFIIKTPNSNPNLDHQATPSEPKFYVRAPQFLEPRRPTPIFLENLLTKCEERTAKAIYRRKCSSRSKYIVHGDPGAANMSSGLTLVEVTWLMITYSQKSLFQSYCSPQILNCMDTHCQIRSWYVPNIKPHSGRPEWVKAFCH